MASQNKTKINKLMKAWPDKTLVTQTWLESHGIYRQLADSYCHNGWLERLDRGVYTKTGDTVTWYGAVYALQTQLNMKTHVAALTAVELHEEHPERLKTHNKFLFINANENHKIPRWFVNNFEKPYGFINVQSNLLAGQWDLGVEPFDVGGFSILVSSVERALLECLYLVPKYVHFEEAFRVMEKMHYVRPHLVQTLLESCVSIKTKRIFLYLAELQNQNWFRYIDVASINLGTGPRKIVEGGRYVAKYQISVPDIE